MMLRKPSVAPSLRASSPASASILPSAWWCRMSASYRVGTCAFGTMRKCTGACGRTSWKARTSSSSWTFFAAISPRTILQNMQLGSLVMFSGGFLVQPGDAFAPVQLGEHVARAEAVPRQQNHAVEPQVGSLAHEVQAIAALCREHGFGRFLADLLEHAVFALRQELRHVRSLRVRRLAGFDERGDALEGLGQSGLHFL